MRKGRKGGREGEREKGRKGEGEREKEGKGGREWAGAVKDKVKKLKEYVDAKGGSRVLRKILIANNGMAATKSIMSMRQWAYLELGLDGVFEFVVAY